VWSRKTWLVFVATLLSGIFYVSQYWSPSSYALALRDLGVADVGLALGEPRPIRTDEWAVVTPLTQAAVRNDFQRFNATSFYGEDFRINYGLPIRDWGLIFKPTMWAYFVVDAARAYSFHWYAVLCMFVLGHALLFRRLGLGGIEASLLSLGLYFTGFTQFWWNEKGPIFAFFPWLLLALLAPIHRGARLALLYWLGVSWLVTNFYPPLFISLAFVAAVVVVAFGRDWLTPRRLAALLITTGCAGLTVALYLKDYLVKTASTVYPGQRTIGGGSVPWREWWGQWMPFNNFDWRFESLVEGQNICEVGVVGAAFALMYLCFLDYRKVRAFAALPSPERSQVAVLVVGLAMLHAWMLLPLQPWVGRIFLWDHVQPERMEYSAGLLLLLVLALVGRSTGFILSAPRMGLYIALVVAGWVYFKRIDGPFLANARAVLGRSNDLVVLPILLACLVWGRRSGARMSSVLMGASTLSGALVLFGFNPIQSARPIFEKHDTPAMRAIQAEITPDGVLAIPGFRGAILNGLGYRSVSHVTAVPALDFWRMRYPTMPESEFLGVFNRYSHVQLGERFVKPMSPWPDVVEVPLSDFWPNRVDFPANRAEVVPTWLSQGNHATGRMTSARAGSIDAIQIFVGTGRGRADGILHVRVCSPLPATCASGARALAEAADNAYFTVRLDRSLVLSGAPAVMTYDLWTHDARSPVALLTQRVVDPSEPAMQLDGVPTDKTVRFRIDIKRDTE
jgi:hypothetical protein